MKPRVLLIDLSALFVPAWRASEHEPISTAFESTIGGVKRACDVFPDALVAICCDGKGNWRKELSADYKAKRDKLPDVFYEQFSKVKDRLRADGRLLWEFEGYEADDVIATAKLEAFARGHQVTIATHDKDLFQLVTKNGCDVLSLGSWEIRGEADVVAKFGVAPAQMADFLALTGDASDNVAGCPGCGPVNAAKLLKAFPDGLAEILQQDGFTLGPVVGPALASKIMANKAQIEESRRLVELKRDVPLRFDDIYEKRETTELVPVQDTVAQAIVATGLPAQLGIGVTYGSSKNLEEQEFYGFAGAGVAAFPDSARTVLSEPVNPNDVEIREDGVVYMSGTFYRRQLTRAFGQGGWALLPRARPVAADGLVVWHGALVCLGRFVSEAFGEHDYQPTNRQASYPTSCEAAKTDCLRRCCKDLGWAGELWSHEWVEDWKKKHAETFQKNGYTRWRKRGAK